MKHFVILQIIFITITFFTHAMKEKKASFPLQKIQKELLQGIAHMMAKNLIQETDPMDHKSIIATRAKILGYNEKIEDKKRKKTNTVLRQTLPAIMAHAIIKEFTKQLNLTTHWLIQPYWRHYKTEGHIHSYSFPEDMKACIILHRIPDQKKETFKLDISFFDAKSKKYKIEHNYIPRMAISDDHNRIALLAIGELQLLKLKKNKKTKQYRFKRLTHCYKEITQKEDFGVGFNILFRGNDTLVCTSEKTKKNNTSASDRDSDTSGSDSSDENNDYATISILSKDKHTNKWTCLQQLPEKIPPFSSLLPHVNSTQNNPNIFWARPIDKYGIGNGNRYSCYLKYERDPQTGQWSANNKKKYLTESESYFNGSKVNAHEVKAIGSKNAKYLGNSICHDENISLFINQEKENNLLVYKNDSGNLSSFAKFTAPFKPKIKKKKESRFEIDQYSIKLTNNHIITRYKNKLACSDHYHSLLEIILKTAIKNYGKNSKTLHLLLKKKQMRMRNFPQELSDQHKKQIEQYISNNLLLHGIKKGTTESLKGLALGIKNLSIEKIHKKKK